MESNVNLCKSWTFSRIVFLFYLKKPLPVFQRDDFLHRSCSMTCLKLTGTDSRNTRTRPLLLQLLRLQRLLHTRFIQPCKRRKRPSQRSSRRLIPLPAAAKLLWVCRRLAGKNSRDYSYLQQWDSFVSCLPPLHQAPLRTETWSQLPAICMLTFQDLYVSSERLPKSYWTTVFIRMTWKTWVFMDAPGLNLSLKGPKFNPFGIISILKQYHEYYQDSKNVHAFHVKKSFDIKSVSLWDTSVPHG